jgi:hypothetical protein
MDVKPILRAGLAVQSLNLVSENIKASRSRRPKLARLAVKNIVGTSLIQAQGRLIESI